MNVMMRPNSSIALDCKCIINRLRCKYVIKVVRKLKLTDMKVETLIIKKIRKLV